MSHRRTNIGKQHPALYRSAVAMSEQAAAAAADAGLAPALVELVRVRVSQLNGCAFCLRVHVADALAAGEAADRLAVLSAWRETAYFSDVERAALGLAEAVTQVSSLPERATDRATADRDLTPEQVSAVSWMAIVMNTFNRIAITSGYAVAPSA